jgi:hypothetical protein
LTTTEFELLVNEYEMLRFGENRRHLRSLSSAGSA